MVSINNFPTDTDAEIELIRELAVGAGAETVVVNRGFAQGGEGAIELAEAVVEACERPNTFHQLTPDGTPLKGQIEAIATKLYGADGVDYLPQAEKDLARMDELGFGTVPVCMAKTHLSLSHDPLALNRPTRVPPARARRGAERRRAGSWSCCAATCSGCPGSARRPNYMGVDIDAAGTTIGLF